MLSAYSRAYANGVAFKPMKLKIKILEIKINGKRICNFVRQEQKALKFLCLMRSIDLWATTRQKKHFLKTMSGF